MMENTDHPADPVTRSRGKSKGRGLILSVVIVGLLLLVGLYVIRSGLLTVRRLQCITTTHQILLALHRYDEEHGTLPPAYTVDAQGNRLHSWRTLILPYMPGLEHVYDQIDLDKPWDDPANRPAWELIGEWFRCQGTSLGDNQLTTYLAVVGPECAFTGPTGRSFREITGPQSSTIAIIDAPPEHAVHWMSPHDITIEEVLSINAESHLQHSGAFVAGFVDGHADNVRSDIDRDVLRSMLTVADDMPQQATK